MKSRVSNGQALLTLLLSLMPRVDSYDMNQHHGPAAPNPIMNNHARANVRFLGRLHRIAC